MRGALLGLVAIVMIGCGGDDSAPADCTRMVCPPGDAGGDDAGAGDAGEEDASAAEDGGETADASAGDGGTSTGDGGVMCMGVHPIVGPPRTCEPGSCLCVAMDACFTVDVAAECCAGDIECAPPLAACMQMHPIIGPPRTCEPGNCYCASPDACFPADRAAECCAVDVVCVE